jgi:hypothetical protein
MKNLGLPSTSTPKPTFNPFAAALAETERESGDSSRANASLNPFSEALAKTGNSLTSAMETPPQEDLLERQKADLIAEQEKQLLRKKLHDQVNPVDTTEIFVQEELKTERALDHIRQELVFLIADAKQFRKEIAIVTQQRVVNPGRTGAYHYNFFAQLRDFIILVRKQIKSARTWLHASNGRKAKMGTVQQTKQTHDRMHHEQQAAFAGG